LRGTGSESGNANKPMHATTQPRAQCSFGGEVAAAVSELQDTFAALDETHDRLDSALQENRWGCNVAFCIRSDCRP
jgi:hypothetical protein